MDTLIIATEALNKAKQELEKNGILLSWEIVAVSKSNAPSNTCTSDKQADMKEAACT